MAHNGRPTEIHELALKIRPLVLEGVSYNEIQKLLNISPNTWDTWVYKDFEGFRADLNNWKKERLIKKAEKTLEELIYAEDDRVRLDASKFTLETLNKEEYSKRSEMTGKDGKDLIPQPILMNMLSVQSNNSDNQNIEVIEAHQSDTGGNLGIEDNLDTPIIDSLQSDG